MRSIGSRSFDEYTVVEMRHGCGNSGHAVIHKIYYLRMTGVFLLNCKGSTVTTEHKIGKVTYFVCSSASENAKDTLNKKVEKLIIRDIGRK